MNTEPTPEELVALVAKVPALAAKFVAEFGDTEPAADLFAEALRVGWDAGYEARKVREKEIFSSAHGTRTVTVLKALLAIVRPSSHVDAAVMQATADFITELEKTSCER